MTFWTKTLTTTELRARADRMHRYGVPLTNPIRRAVREETLWRAQDALASVTRDPNPRLPYVAGDPSIPSYHQPSYRTGDRVQAEVNRYDGTGHTDWLGGVVEAVTHSGDVTEVWRIRVRLDPGPTREFLVRSGHAGLRAEDEVIPYALSNGIGTK